MKIRSIVENDMKLDPISVWVLDGHEEFGYSEGRESERYLERVFRQAQDLSGQSSELQAHIRDWSSEYHLSVKRAQLLSGFTFERSLRVLEVGCGCGAITRYLGESFDHVVSVEGSIHRARLAKLRTRDLPSVNILCAPFQELRFSSKFDIVFCIGVYEYSASFIDDPDPYDAVLKYFGDILTDDGAVVIAIENQFGLKYFASSREDHLGVMFEGLEGYHSGLGKVRTFGRVELEANVRKHFPVVQFFYPYPDYKLPDCVLTEDLLSNGQSGELISMMRGRDYAGKVRPLWDEAATLLELARNRMLAFFANSFLVVAGKTQSSGISFDHLGVLFSSERKSEFWTRTTILRQADGQMAAIKRGSHTGPAVSESGRSLRLVDTDSQWMNSPSLHTQVYLRCKATGRTLESIFSPCTTWVGYLVGASMLRDGERYLPGDHVDCTWSNVFIESGSCKVIDQEWIWQSDIRIGAIIVRGIFAFLSTVEDRIALPGRLRWRSGKTQIREIAHAIGYQLTERDFSDFVELEADLQATVFGLNRRRHEVFLKWFLFDRVSLNLCRRMRVGVLGIRSMFTRVIGALPIPWGRQR